MTGWKHIANYDWRNEKGEVVCRHIKWLKPDGEKTMPWRMIRPSTQRWAKPSDLVAEGVVSRPLPHQVLLYNLPELLAAGPRADAWITEGEADADALMAVGVLAVTHGHAGSFTDHHARWFRNWRGRITLARDNDLPGAYDAALRYDQLRAVGVAASRLRIVRGRVRGKGADARDHLDSGYTVAEFIPEPIAKVRKLAAKAAPESFTRAGYGDWAVVTADEAAQLKDWKPVAP